MAKRLLPVVLFSLLLLLTLPDTSYGKSLTDRQFGDADDEEGSRTTMRPTTTTTTTLTSATTTSQPSVLRLFWSAVVGLRDNDCRLECPNGDRPLPVTTYAPSIDGCGSYGFSIDFMNNIPDVQECCNQHDSCYHTCGSSRRTCDYSFQGCLYNYCQRRYEDEDDIRGRKRDLRVCRRLADMAKTTVRLLGCGAYLEDQSTACTCPQPPSQPPS